MGVHFSWYNDEKTVILIKFDPEWSWSDLEVMDREGDAMIESVPHPKVCYLIDASETNVVPHNLSPRRVKEVLDMGHPKSDLAVVVGMQTFVRLMLNIWLKFVPEAAERFVLVGSLEEAEAVLQQRLNELYGETATS